MSSLFNTLSERYQDLIAAIFQHIYISLLSLLIAIIIAIPLVIYLRKHKTVLSIFLQLTGVFQTIPSLAILGLLIPIVGIGNKAAIIALVIYGLLPIVQNTYTAFESVDPSYIEASDALALTPKKKLFLVELPLCMPLIIAGIRISFVMIIGSATLAALIGAGGLGNFILLGIDRNNVNLILIGAISSACLALLFSYLLKKMEMLSFKKILYSFLLLLTFFIAHFSYSLTQHTTQITIAGKLGSEPEIIMNMYKLLIEEDNPDVKVVLKPNFGKTSFLFNAVISKEIDLYTEYTGTILENLVNNPNQSSNDTKVVYDQSKKLLQEQFHATISKPMGFQNTYALAVPKQLAIDNNLISIQDLNNNSYKAGFTLEFKDRKDGYPNLQKLYHLNLDIVTMEPKLRYQAIANQQVQVVEAYSTDSDIIEHNLILLKDDKQAFPPYQAVALMLQEFEEKYPNIVHSINKLENIVNEEQMQKMNYLVNIRKEKPFDVAQNFLKKEKLIR